MNNTINGQFGLLEDYSIWRDFENNKVYVKYGTETIEVPHAIAEAYRQYEAESFHLYHAMIDRSELLTTENDKLRELVADMWHSAMTNCDFAERYAFADEFNERMLELKVEV